MCRGFLIFRTIPPDGEKLNYDTQGNVGESGRELDRLRTADVDPVSSMP